jgi:hypothetical protein
VATRVLAKLPLDYPPTVPCFWCKILHRHLFHRFPSIRPCWCPCVHPSPLPLSPSGRGVGVRAGFRFSRSRIANHRSIVWASTADGTTPPRGSGQNPFRCDCPDATPYPLALRNPDRPAIGRVMGPRLGSEVIGIRRIIACTTIWTAAGVVLLPNERLVQGPLARSTRTNGRGRSQVLGDLGPAKCSKGVAGFTHFVSWCLWTFAVFTAAAEDLSPTSFGVQQTLRLLDKDALAPARTLARHLQFLQQ